MDDREFKIRIKSILKENRDKARDILKEYGDEFGPVDLGNFSDLKKVFMEPFTDAWDTTKGAIADVGSKALAVAEIFVKGIPAIVLPLFTVKFDKIFERERSRMQAIERKYGDAFKKSRGIWKSEAGKIAFLLNPLAITAASIGQISAKQSLDVADAISGYADPVRRMTRVVRDEFGLGESIDLMSCLLYEKNIKSSKALAVKKLFESKEFENAIRATPHYKAMQADGRAMKNESLNEIKSIAQDIDDLDSIDSLEEYFGRRFSDELDDEDVEEENIKKIEGAIVRTAKNSAIGLIISKLDLQLEELENLEIPEVLDLVGVYKKVKDQIEEMLEDN